MSDTLERHPLHWLPNALTVGRCLLVPVVIIGLILPFEFDYEFPSTNFQYYVAFIAFLLCAVTDFFDGYFARKFNVTSDFGRMLDPIADKILVAGTLISICILVKYGWIVTFSFIIIFRDFAVSGIREFAANSNKVLAPTKLAKWKTAIEMLAIILYMIYLIAMTHDPQWFFWADGTPEIIPKLFKVSEITLGIAAALSAYTGFHYFREALKKP